MCILVKQINVGSEYYRYAHKMLQVVSAIPRFCVESLPKNLDFGVINMIVNE